MVLSYLGKTSLDLRTRLRRTVERDLPYCKLKAIFRYKCNTLYYTILIPYIIFKDSIEDKNLPWKSLSLHVQKMPDNLLQKNLWSLLYQNGLTHGDLQSYKKNLKNVKQSEIPDYQLHIMYCHKL